MTERSRRIMFHDDEKISNINPETMKLYNKYKMDMTIRELSESTIEGYDNDLSHWFIYIYDNQNNQCITELEEDDIIEFIFYCKSEGNNSRRMKRRMSSISAFYKFLRRKKLITENPMEFIERPKKDTDIVTQTYLNPQQITLLKEKLKENGDLQLEVFALFSLSTMARVNAVSNTKWDQIDFENRVVNDVLEKEGRKVTLYFNEEVKDLLLKLQQERIDKEISDDGFVFITYYKEKYSRASKENLQDWIKRVGELIGVPTLHCHDLRHSAATLLKNEGMSLEDVSALLNHLSTEVTKKFYIKADITKISKNKDKYSI